MPSVSDEQIRRAKEVDVLAYLRTYEPDNLKRDGAGRYILRDHDSLVVSNGKFCWNSRGVGGYSALDFLLKVRGMGFVDAVLHLTGSGAAYIAERPPPRLAPKPFVLPPANTNNDRIIAYLRGRGIDKDIINRCISNGSLYESRTHSCVFVGFDGGTARFACERGTTGDSKKDVFGSDKRFSFHLPPKAPDSHNLMATESPVDVLSHATIHKLDSDKWDGWRLSLGGIGSTALINFLERHPQIERITLCLDSDKAGVDAANRIIRELLSDKRFRHLRITNAPPSLSLGKDYNDALQAIIQLHKQKLRSDRQKGAVCLF